MMGGTHFASLRWRKPLGLDQARKLQRKLVKPEIPSNSLVFDYPLQIYQINKRKVSSELKTTQNVVASQASVRPSRRIIIDMLCPRCFGCPRCFAVALALFCSVPALSWSFRIAEVVGSGC